MKLHEISYSNFIKNKINIPLKCFAIVDGLKYKLLEDRYITREDIMHLLDPKPDHCAIYHMIYDEHPDNDGLPTNGQFADIAYMYTMHGDGCGIGSFNYAVLIEIERVHVIDRTFVPIKRKLYVVYTDRDANRNYDG